MPLLTRDYPDEMEMLMAEVEQEVEAERALQPQQQAQPQPALEPPEEPGFLKKTFQDIVGGVYDAGEGYVRAARALPGGPEAGVNDHGYLSQGIENIEGYRKQTPFLKPHEGAWHEGVRSAVQSVTTAAPGIGAGAALGAAVSGPLAPIGAVIGGALGYAMSAAGVFGLSEYDRSKEQALKKGMPDDQAEAYAFKNAAWETGSEFLADSIQAAMVVGSVGTATPQALAVGNTIKVAIKEVFKQGAKQGFKAFGKRAAVFMGSEVGTEALTAGMQAENARDYGIGNQRFWDAAYEAVGPASVASLIFLGFGEAGRISTNKAMRKNLEDPGTEPKKRLAVAAKVEEEIKKVSPEVAAQWRLLSSSAIVNKESIPVDETVLETPINPTPAQAHPPEGPTPPPMDEDEPYLGEEEALPPDVTPNEDVTENPAAVSVPPVEVIGRAVEAKGMDDNLNRNAIDTLSRQFDEMSQGNTPDTPLPGVLAQEETVPEDSIPEETVAPAKERLRLAVEAGDTGLDQLDSIMNEAKVRGDAETYDAAKNLYYDQIEAAGSMGTVETEQGPQREQAEWKESRVVDEMPIPEPPTAFDRLRGKLHGKQGRLVEAVDKGGELELSGGELENGGQGISSTNENRGETSAVDFIDNVPVGYTPVDNLKLSDDVPNFKEGSDENGVVKRLEGKFKTLGTAPIVVWERKNGDMEVITGRHRLDLARRTGHNSILSQVVKEKDGFTQAMAMVFDAESNIRDDQGSVKDYANYFKNADIDEKRASSEGLLRSDKGRKGFIIGKNAENDLYALFRNDEIGQEKAAVIAGEAPNNAELQRLGIIYSKAHSVNDTRSYLKAVQAIVPDPNDVQQMDMFGANSGWKEAAEKMAKAATRLINRIKNEKRALNSAGTLSKDKYKEFRKAYGINAGDPSAIKARLLELNQSLAYWDKWNSDPTLLDQVRREAGLEAQGNISDEIKEQLGLFGKPKPTPFKLTPQNLSKKEKLAKAVDNAKKHGVLPKGKAPVFQADKGIKTVDVGKQQPLFGPGTGQQELFTNEKGEIEPEFKPVEAKRSTGGAPIPARQRTRMVYTGGSVRAASWSVSNGADAAALLSKFRKHKQENFFIIPTDKNGKVLEVFLYSKGTRNSSQYKPSEIAGYILNTPDAESVYLVHNHPSGQAFSSPQDQLMARLISAALKTKDKPPSVNFLVIGGVKWCGFDAHGDIGGETYISSNPKNVEIPVKEGIVTRKSSYAKSTKVQGSDIARSVIRSEYGDQEGFLLLDQGNQDIGFVRFIPGKPMKDTTRRLMEGMGKTNATSVLFNSKVRLGRHSKRVSFLKDLIRENNDDFALIEILDPRKSFRDTGLYKRPESHGELSLFGERLEPTAGTLGRYKHIGSEQAMFSQAAAPSPKVDAQARNDIAKRYNIPAASLVYHAPWHINGKTLHQYNVIQPGHERHGSTLSYDPAKGEIVTGPRTLSRNAHRQAQLPAKYTPVPVKRLEALARRVPRQWSNAPEVVVVEKQADLPASITQKEGQTVSGAYHDNKVYLVAENLQSFAFARKTLFHEVLGHHGFRLIRQDKDLAPRLDRFMDRLYKSEKASIDTIADQYGYDVGGADGRMLASEEWLARQAEGNPRNTWVRRAVAMIRQWLSKVAPGLKVSSSEIAAWVGQMRKAVVEGKTGINEFAQPQGSRLSKAIKSILDNPKFRRWFGNSVVTVDGKKGSEPLVVYHGTNEQWFVPDAGKQKYGAFFFSPEMSIAEGRGRNEAEKANHVMPVYLSIKNPKITDIWFSGEIDTEELTSQGYDGVIGLAGLPDDAMAGLIDDFEKTGKITGEIVAHTAEIAAFHPTQIKSIYNTGEFSPTNPDIRFSFAGQKAKSADFSAKAKAEKMLDAGEDAKKVWRETGWMKKKDGWKFEIDDSGAKWKPGFIVAFKKTVGKGATLGNYMSHPTLFKAYPELKNLSVVFKNLGNSNAVYCSESKTIEINNTLTVETKMSPEDATLKTALHEIQHAIQDIEGFARGGSPETVDMNYLMQNDKKFEEFSKRMDDLSFDGFDWDSKEMKAVRDERDAYIKESLTDKYGEDYGFGIYNRLAGEIEARDAAERSDLTPAQRREQMPYTDMGYEIFDKETGEVVDRLSHKEGPLTDYVDQEVIKGEDPNFGVRKIQRLRDGIPASEWIYKKGDGTSFSVSKSPKPADHPKVIKLKKEIARLKPKVDTAYESGSNNAEALDAELDEAYTELENILTEIDENQDSSDFESNNDSEQLGLDDDLAMAYQNMFVDKNSFQYGNTQKENIDVLRYILESHSWQHGKFDKNTTDSQVFDAAKDAYEYLAKRQSRPSSKEGQPRFSMVTAEIWDKKTASLPDFITEKFGKTEKSGRQKLEDALTSVKKRDWWDRVATLSIDRLHPIKTKTSEEAYRLHRLATGSQAAMAMFLRHGKLRWEKSGLMTVDSTNQGFLNFLKGLGGDGNKFLYWVAARRAEVLESEGREHWLDKNARDRIFEWAGGKNLPKWTSAAKKLQKFNDSVLDLAQEADLIDGVSRAKWSKQFYVPFYRVFEDEKERHDFLTRPDKISSQIKRLTGGEEKLGDPLENLLKNWSHLINESMRNKARKAAFDFSKKTNSGLVGEIDKSKLNIYKNSKDGKMVYITNNQDNVLMYLEKGKPVYFKVNDPGLFQAMSNLNTHALDNFLMKIMNRAKKALTYGATFGPGFRIANMLRDTLHTSMVAKSFKPFLDTGRGIVKAWREDKEYVAFMASGAGFGSSYIRDDNPKALSEYVNRIVKKEGDGVKKRILDTPKKMLDFWEKVGASSENAARVQLYSNLLKEGKSHFEAAFQARDLLDFTMRGEANVVQVLIQTIPFLNARMQGLYKLGRIVADKDTRKNFMLRGGLLMTASLALWALHKDDDEYKELEDWDKWSYYHFWIGDKHFRIPKPFEVGALFSAFPESMADVLYGNEDTKHIAEMVGYTAKQTFAISLPQLITPMIEQWANRSSYTGRPIVGQALQGLLPGEQAEPWTSETMKMAGKLGISPKRAEALIQGYFSTFGMFLLGISDIAMRNIFDFPEKATQKIDDYPAIGRFVKSKGPARYTRYQTWFYEMYDEIDRMSKTIRHYRDTGNYENADALFKKGLRKLRYKKGFSQIRRQLSAINSRAKAVMRSRRLDDQEKRDAIDDLAEKRNGLVKMAWDIFHDRQVNGS